MTLRALSRRDWVRVAGGVLAGPLLAACGASRTGAAERLLIPTPLPGDRLPPGLHTLGTGGERDGVVSVPVSAGPSPLVVMLHGAGGTGRRAARLIGPAAESAGCIVLAPDSRGATWDALTGAFGPDVAFLSRALAQVLERCAVDTGRLALAGFSDGATYALGLGLANGDRFTHLLGFSPGFLIPTRPAGAPGIFVSHGVADDVLPIDTCSRKLVPALRRKGYRVRYREFAGRHEVPPAIAQEGLAWFLDRAVPSDPA
jgi:phospholipase/carboxylesterase